MAKPSKSKKVVRARDAGYGRLFKGISALLTDSRRAAVRTLNGILTATYWEAGRRIVEFEQGGRVRAGYGEELLERLSADLMKALGRGFSATNLRQMRAFYLGWQIQQTLSAELEMQAITDSSEQSSADVTTNVSSPATAIAGSTVNASVT